MKDSRWIRNRFLFVYLLPSRRHVILYTRRNILNSIYTKEPLWSVQFCVGEEDEMMPVGVVSILEYIVLFPIVFFKGIVETCLCPNLVHQNDLPSLSYLIWDEITLPMQAWKFFFPVIYLLLFVAFTKNWTPSAGANGLCTTISATGQNEWFINSVFNNFSTNSIWYNREWSFNQNIQQQKFLFFCRFYVA